MDGRDRFFLPKLVSFRSASIRLLPVKALCCSPIENDLGHCALLHDGGVRRPREPEGPETESAPTTTVAGHQPATRPPAEWSSVEVEL